MALMSLIFAVSCQMQEPGSGNLAGEVDFSISAGIPGGITTYSPEDGTAFSHQGGANNVNENDYDLRYILEIYDDGDAVAYRDEKVVKENFTAEGVTFNARLLAKKYDVVLWADFVKEGMTDDLYYATDDLKSISYTSNVISDVLATDAADAYYTFFEMDLTESSQSMKDVKLTRPFGKMRFIATDKLSAGVNQSERPASVIMDFGGAEVPSSFNALTGEASGSKNVGIVKFPAVQEDALVKEETKSGAYLLGYAYFFASNSSSSAYPVDITVFSDESTTNQIGKRSVSSVPVQENKLTTVIGNFYTNDGSIEVIVEDLFGNGEEIHNLPETVNVGTLEEAQAFIETFAADPSLAEKDVVITISGELAAGDNEDKLELPKLSNNVTLVLENGISAVGLKIEDIKNSTGEGGNDFTGKLILKNNSTESQGALEINLPAGSCELQGSVIYSSVVVTTAENTLVIGEDATVESLTVKGGNVKILGTVNPEQITISNSTSKIYWGAGTEARLREVLGYDASKNHGVILTADILGATGTDGACVRVNHDGYLFDGNGHTLSGNASQNVMVIGGDNVEVRDLTITQPAEGSASNGLSAYRVTGIQLTDVTIHDCRKAAAIINGSEVIATGLRTYGNSWGAVNVGKGSGVTEAPVFTFDATCSFEEPLKVWVDCEKPWTVNAPEGWSSYENGNVTVFVNGSALDGKGTETEPYLIKGESDLRILEKMVNAGKTFEGEFISIENDIDLKNEPFEPMGKFTNQVFRGSIDGKGHTISNLYIDNFDGNDGVSLYYAGLFYTFNGTLKNLNVKNAYVEGVRASVLVGRMDGGTIESCHVSDASVKGIQKNGAIAGFINAGSADIRIAGCSVRNCSFTSAYDGAYWQTGAISGYMSVGTRNVLIEDNTVENITISGTEKSDDFYYMEQLYSHPFVGNVVNMSKTEGAFEKYTTEFRNNKVTGSDHNDVSKCERTTEYFGWYAGDCNASGYLYSSKVVVDGNELDRFVEFERLAAQVAAGGNVTIYRDYSFDEWGKSIEIPTGKEVVLDLSKYIVSGKESVIVNNGKLTVKSTGGKGKIMTTSIIKGATAVMNNAGAELVFESGNIEAKVFALLNEGTAYIKGGVIASSSKNSDKDDAGNTVWAYCVRTQEGGQMFFTGGTITGIQGGLACQGNGSKVTISDDANIEVKHSAPGKNDCWYALYSSWEAMIEVLGGKFYSDRNPCAYASDEDQPGTPIGAFVLKGGKYSSQPKGNNGLWSPVSGYKFIETGDPTYPFEIVPQ